MGSKVAYTSTEEVTMSTQSRGRKVRSMIMQTSNFTLSVLVCSICRVDHKSGVSLRHALWFYKVN